jgi:hypothetical protein
VPRTREYNILGIVSGRLVGLKRVRVNNLSHGHIKTPLSPLGIGGIIDVTEAVAPELEGGPWLLLGPEQAPALRYQTLC